MVLFSKVGLFAKALTITLFETLMYYYSNYFQNCFSLGANDSKWHIEETSF